MSARGQTEWVPWDVTDGIHVFFFMLWSVQQGVFSQLLRSGGRPPVRTENAHMFASDLKYRCVHYVSETFTLQNVQVGLPLDIGDPP